MKDLIIIGASGFGREILQWVKDINKTMTTFKIKGFIDDNLKALDGYECDYNVLGTIKDWVVSDNEVFTCAIADPTIKEKVIIYLKNRGAIFTNIIHPTSIISEFCKIGEGLILTAYGKISPNVVIGDFVSILGSGIGHDARVGDYSTITGNCSINGNVKLGKKVFVASNSCIAPSKKIGDNAFIGMGSMVISNVKANTKVWGSPAKRMDF